MSSVSGSLQSFDEHEDPATMARRTPYIADSNESKLNDDKGLHSGIQKTRKLKPKP